MLTSSIDGVDWQASRATRPIAWDLAAVVALSVVALGLRLVVAERGGLWRDEALFLFVARSDSWSSMLDFLRLHESHPPLFYAIMRTWLSVFGSGDTSAVILPVAFGVILVPTLYLVGASLFSRRLGVFVAALGALSPALTEYSAEVRPYSLLPLLALLSSFALIRGLQHGGWKSWAGYILSTLTMVYTHNWGWLVLGGQWVSVFVVLTIGAGRRRGELVREWLLAQLVIALCFMPWAPWLVYQIRHAGHAPTIYSQDGISAYVAKAARDLLQATLTAYQPVADGTHRLLMSWFLALPIILLVADQFLRARRANNVTSVETASSPNGELKSSRLPLIILTVVPFSAWLAAVALSRRTDLLPLGCLATLAPFLLLDLAYWLLRPRTGLMLHLSRAAAVALVLTYAVTLYGLTQASRSNAQEFAGTLAATTEPTDLVIVTPEWMASSFNRYFRLPVEQIDYPHFGPEGAVSFTDLRALMSDSLPFKKLQQQIAEARQGGRRTWLIMDRDQVFRINPSGMRSLLASSDYGVVGFARSNQIRVELISRYGQPDTTAVATGTRARYENFRAFLFAPSR